MKQILIRPIITEKTMNLADSLGKYTFMVNTKSNKIEIAKEVSSRFKVTVLDVNIINILGKKVTFGKKRIPGKKSDFKKAIVQLKSGDKIKIFDIK